MRFSVKPTARWPVWSVVGFELSIWSPLKSGVSSVGSGWPWTACCGPGSGRCRTSSAGSGTKSRRPVWPTSFSMSSLFADARQLDDDAVGALRLDDGLRHAGRVHAALDDVADRAEVAGSRRPAVLGQRPGTRRGSRPRGRDRASSRRTRALPLASVRNGQLRARPEVEDKRAHTDDDDQVGGGSAHRGGMIQPSRPRRPPAARCGRCSRSRLDSVRRASGLKGSAPS